MIINLEIEDKLAKEALQLTGYQTLEEAVEEGLKLIIQHYTINLPKPKKVLERAGKKL